jgi:hypothetical protein
MAVDPLSADFQRMVYRNYPRTVSFDGPQEGTILPGASIGSARVLVPAFSQTLALGPAPLPFGLDVAPAPGTRCLVLFVGVGVGDPWIVAITTVPL